jgi:hypothetical protein
MDKELKDLRILALFTSVYCAAHHQEAERSVVDFGLPGTTDYRCCADCADFLSYAIERRQRCPLKPKPLCKHCTVHCYRPGHREKVREVMRYSGKALIKRGRLDLLWHYLF